MQSLRLKLEKFGESFDARWIVPLECAAVYVVLFLMILSAVSPEQHDIHVGDVSQATITATKDVEDAVTTKTQRDAAAKAVLPHYISDAAVLNDVILNVDHAITRLTQVRERFSTPPEPDSADEDTRQRDLAWAIAHIKPMLLSEDKILELCDASPDDFSRLTSVIRRIMREQLNSKVAEGQEAEVAARLQLDLTNVYEIAPSLAVIGGEIARAYLKPNMLMDEVATEESRLKAVESVQPIIYRKGQNIVVAGEVITPSQYAMLDGLGMIKNQSIDFKLYIGIAVLLAAMLMVIALYLAMFEAQMLIDAKTVALLCIIFVMVTGISLVTRGLSEYFMPVALGAMLITVLIKARLALIVNMILAVVVGMLASSGGGLFSPTMVNIMLTAIISSSVGVTVLRVRRQQRMSVVWAGLCVSAMNMLIVLSLGFISNTNLSITYENAVWAGANGLLATVLCVGLQPVFEALFNLVTPSKLMELSNPRQTLLKRLMMEAPGTYHHSIVVANLAEAAAEAIEADALLCRVGAYYHDIGKLKRPMYFKENQIGDNPHDETDPYVSASIVISHPQDGERMGSDARLPEAIIDIIKQHHGDTPVMYFYYRAVTRDGEAKTDIERFRYVGPKPTTREAAILMLADTVEAAVRSLPEPTRANMYELIHRLVKSKVDDGQMDACPLTFRQINQICDAFMIALMGVYHERIEYPQIEIPHREAITAGEKAEENADADAPDHYAQGHA